MENEIFIRILLTVVFGAILGLETETREVAIKGKEKAKEEEQSRIGGLRTYTILSLLGGVAGIFFANDEHILAYISFIAITILIIVAYALNVMWKHAFGMTTEIAIFITFLIGFLTTSSLVPLSVIIFILVLLGFFLSQKRGIGEFIHKIKHEEVIDVLKFGLLSIVILPVLPNETYTLANLSQSLQLEENGISFSSSISNIEIINPFQMWILVLIITGIDLVSQILKQIIGSKGGFLVTGFIGGLVSSTSTTVAFATKSKTSDEREAKAMAGGSLIANAVSLPSALLLILVVNQSLFNELSISLMTMCVLGIIYGLFLILSNSRSNEASAKVEVKYEPFSISPAIKFVALVVLITIAIQFAQLSGNDIVTTVVTAVSGLTGMNAPTIALSNLVGSGELALMLAAFIFLVTNAINFGSKAFIAYSYGSRTFFKYQSIGLLITILGTLTIFI